MTRVTAYFDPGSLIATATALFEKADLPPEHAAIVAQGLVEANLRGIDSHGASRIPMYLTRLRRGVVNPRPNIRVERMATAAAQVDGDDGMGLIVGRRAMEEGIALAQDTGIGLVGIRRSTHYGMAALYVLQAIEAGMMAIACTNSSPALPVWGGRTSFLGASPLAVGIPGGARAPYVLDMAMTVIARGKIRLAAQHGETIPEGLALDAQGRPTQDARQAFEGVCLPFGGLKGAALSMLMDLLAGVFTGANFGGEVKSLYFDHAAPQNVGHLFIVMRPDLFMPQQAFEERMDLFVDRAKACPRAAGVDEILMPGEPEERAAAERRRTGIPISADVERELRAETDAAGIAFPEGSRAPLALAS